MSSPSSPSPKQWATAVANPDPAWWDYDQYRRVYPKQVCHIRTSQSGTKCLEPAVRFCREGEPPSINNEVLSHRIRAVWRGLLGPSRRQVGPLQARILESREFPHCLRRKVEYQADPNEPVRAWLFLPKCAGSGKLPAVLCLHQTVREGKDQTAGLSTAPELAFGPLLAERGYVTLCPDAVCFGERYQAGGSFYCHYGDAIRIYAGDEGRSILSKMVDDAMRAVDYLAALPTVDSTRIGAIGHSHGGYGTLFAMAYDERIKAGVVSCGFTCFRADPAPERWYRRTALLPRLGGFEGRMEAAPVDFHHLPAAIAPRGLFLSVALKDSIFPRVGDVPWLRSDMRSVYERGHATKNFYLHAFDGEHAFTDSARDLAWEFLDAQLK